jgi:hypothetical protein
LPNSANSEGFAPQPCQPLGIEPHMPAQLSAAIIDDQQLDDAALGLRLDGDLAAILLHQRPDQRADGDRLGEDELDAGGVIVRSEDFAQHAVQPHEPPARILAGKSEMDGRSVEGGAHGWLYGVEMSKRQTAPGPNPSS